LSPRVSVSHADVCAKNRSIWIYVDLRVYLKAVSLLLAVPDGAGQWELLADPVLLHWAQRPPTEPLRLSVVCVQPQVLELGMRLARKSVALEDLIESLKVSCVEGDQRSRSHDGLVSV